MNYNEKRSLIISFALFFLVLIVYLLNAASISQATNMERVSVAFYAFSLLGLFVIAILSIAAVYREKKVVEKLREMQEYDSLTGCSNWIKFQADCEVLIKDKQNQRYTMVIFDIDKFKAINDLFGYEVGNEILTAIARILENYIEKDELFSRTATDNFNILMKYDGYGEFSDRIEGLIREINAYSKNFIVNISLGIYLIEDRTLKINIFSDRANMAKRSIKNNSQVDYAFYTESMRVVMIHENEIENRMEAALINKEFEVYLQPKYLFSDEKIIGAEALVRWNDPEYGLLPPNDFIPLFEKNGFVRKIDTFMFKEVCKLMNKWKNETDQFDNIVISVNFSRLDMNNSRLPEELLKIANLYNIEPKMIEIELTESTIFDNDIQLAAILNHLKDYGFQISIDDFGRAYSSLNTLKSLPADILKMDKAFFSESANNQRGRKIIKCVLYMAKDLNLITVAEGVETIEQVEFLREMGCDIAQGFYYAKPMKVTDFEDFVIKKQKSA
ncbi:putative bifunctional diguanylate cyclase/phosphodiesterase [Acetobacterium tundrae]|uniref:EAL domain-containing protein n=1 Tax=Acetobacterium tundrae TaxID=132932 RepID=A0ABR6WLL4_9FIRM|nr:bifunctional diguanylate cyclase/phosphodiesterase [Acetobacterium tundrae]MBC3797022.1 EAL domain-containing protein [Acetobacterium tundrae]